MENEKLKEKIKAFREDQFSKVQNKKKCKILEDTGYAVLKAYADMMPRTIRKNDSDDSNVHFCEEGVEDVKKWLVVEFKKYFMKDCEFNKWHSDICNKFVTKFNDEVLGNHYKHIKFGKAQKIVNMTFKYLYCFDDAYVNEKKFEYCHIPIDGNVIKWYNKKVSTNGNGVEKIKTAWSNFSQEEYIKIQKEVFNYLKSNKEGLPELPLEADFYIWEEYK